MSDTPDENEDGRVVPMAGRHADPLDALLEINVSTDSITETVDVPIIPPKGAKTAPVIPWTLKVLDDETMDDLRERATKTVKRGRQRERELNFRLFNSLLVGEATVEPNLRDSRLLGKFGSMEPHKMLRKLLLPGTITKLADKVMELGGYDDDELVEAGKD